MNKESLRKLVLKKRSLLSPKDVREKSKIIREKLFEQTEFQNAKNVFTYISFANEVRTQEIIEKCISLKKKVFVPVVDEKSNELIIAEFLGFEKLKKNSLGVMEPFPIKIFPLREIDFILVPGIAYDQSLNRLGFGKGFFDKFLSKLVSKIPIIAIAFELQIVERVPVAEKDIKVQKILTEKRII